jgi:ABC-type dipeptide/oligopeptide/nickel transport system permease subunit
MTREIEVVKKDIEMPDYMYDKSVISAGTFEEQLKEIKEKFTSQLFTPWKKNDELAIRKQILNRSKSKRKFAYKLLSPLMIFGFVLVLVVTSLAVFAPWASPETYRQITMVQENRERYAFPYPGHPLGLGELGRDVLGRIIWGARTSISLGLFSIVISVTLGTILGLFVAYKGGILDDIVMRLVDIVFAFPGLIIVLLIVSIFGRQMENILLTYGFLGIAFYIRLIRGQVLSEKNKPYIEAARVSGASTMQIIFRHILPNTFAPTLISFTFDIGGNILGLAGLSFIGFGDSRFVEWGYDLSQSRSQLFTGRVHAVFWPGLMILGTVLGFMLLGDGLRDALDPRIQGEN